MFVTYFVVFSYSAYSIRSLFANPEKTTSQYSQSRLLSAEQGKENKKENVENLVVKGQNHNIGERFTVMYLVHLYVIKTIRLSNRCGCRSSCLLPPTYDFDV